MSTKQTQKASNDELIKLQNVVVSSLLSSPSLISSHAKMDFQLFNYLIGSLAHSDKNTLFDYSASASIPVQTLSDKIKKIDMHADLDELQNLFGDRNSVTAQQLYNLFSEQGALDLDPYKHAGILFDEDGYMSEEKVRKVMNDMGFEDMKPKEMKIIIQSFDRNGDGHVCRKDFQTVLQQASEKQTKQK